MPESPISPIRRPLRGAMFRFNLVYEWSAWHHGDNNGRTRGNLQSHYFVVGAARWRASAQLSPGGRQFDSAVSRNYARDFHPSLEGTSLGSRKAW
jgi:hypothetical protein